MSMFPIATQTLSSNTSVVQFANIPQTYTHLRIVALSKGTFNNGGNSLSIYVYFNGSVANLTNRQGVKVDGAGPAQGTFFASSSQGTIGTVADNPTNYPNYFGVTLMDIFDYRNTNKAKTLSYYGGSDLNGMGSVIFGNSCWNNTSAINTIDLSTDGQWTANSTFQLYGIDTASVGTF